MPGDADPYFIAEGLFSMKYVILRSLNALGIN
jgi:hypothetical protein